MIMAKYETIDVTHDDRGILGIRLSRPEKRNAFNAEMIQELTQVLLNEASESDVRTVVLSGDGKVFCAGGDLNWMKKSVDLTYEENLQDTRDLTEMFALFNELPKPVVGLVHGAAIGGAVGLVSVCDLVLCVKGTIFGLSEVRLGLIPACIGPFVVSKIGASHARGLFMIGERFDAQRAYEVGLVHKIVSDEKSLKTEADILIDNILACAPSAMAHAKKLVLDLSWPERRAEVENCYEYVAEVLAQLRVSVEGQEGVRAFLEKRKPSWLVGN